MATKNLDLDIHSVRCQLCQELYKDPLLLPCLHSFCKKCLVREREQQGSSEGGKLKCPSCEEHCEIPSGDITGFVQNIYLARKVEMTKIEEKMKSKENVPCDRCVESSNAVSFCRDCLFLCKTCSEDHKHARVTMKHELIDIESKQALTKITNNRFMQINFKPLYCSQHKEEKLQFYCEQCSILTCRDCIVIGHVGHSMKSHNAVAEESREEIKRNISTITTEMFGSLDDIITQGETMIERIKNRQGQVEREINTSFDAVIEAIENRRKTLLMEATSIANGKICAVKEQLDGCRKIRKDMVHIEKFAQDVSENHLPTEVLNSKKLINTRVQQVTKQYSKATKEIKEDEVVFTAFGSHTLTKLVNMFGLVSDDLSHLKFDIESSMTIPIATINEERKVSVSVHDTKGSPIPFDFLRTFPIVSTLKDPNGQESNVPHSIDQESGIVSFSFIPIAIGEHYLSIKINGSHINESPYRLMVCMKYDGSLTNERSFNVGTNVIGVAVHTNGDVYASAYNDGCIKVFSGNGTLKKTIGSQGNGNGQFNRPWGLTILDDVLYVAEYSNNRVQKLSLDGKYIGHFGTRGSGQGQLNYPQGITHDCKGRILVADKGNKRIQVFDGSSCSFLKSIDCQGNNPSDVAVDSDGNIHITYHNAHCVAIFSPDGQQHIANYSNTSGHFQYPRAITIDERGYHIVTCESGYLHIMDTKGQQVNRLGGLTSPYDVAIDQYGAIYVTDYSNKCIVKYV